MPDDHSGHRPPKRPRQPGERGATAKPRSVTIAGLDETARLQVVAGAAERGLALNDRHLAEFDAFLRLLGTWAARFNLLAAGDLGQVVPRHLLDSLSALPLIADLGRPLRIADIGSGAGFPGIPLGIALRPDRLLLVEPRQHRASFLRAVAREIPDLAMSVAQARIEDLDEPAGSFDAVVSRATLPLPELAAGARRLLRTGGRLISLRGPNQTAPDSLPGFHGAGTQGHIVAGVHMRAEAWERT